MGKPRTFQKLVQMEPYPDYTQEEALLRICGFCCFAIGTYYVGGSISPTSMGLLTAAMRIIVVPPIFYFVARYTNLDPKLWIPFAVADSALGSIAWKMYKKDKASK